MQGRLIVQAKESLPIHLGSIMGMMKALLARVDIAALQDGDIFVANDPFVAGGTLQDRLYLPLLVHQE